MGPMKKSKSVNKGFARVAIKDEKSKHKKRKLPDMLGPRWSKLELEHFYQAYRKYDKDWKKVASSVRSRSIEMVEALYNMNRAYLSLPEGIASVSGLIAMMTDHYNVNGECGGERENDEHTVVSRKVLKHSKVKVQVGPVKVNHVQLQSIGSSHRSQSSSKVGFDVISAKVPVKKRTARVPVSSLGLHPKKKLRGSSMNMSSDKVSCGAYLLTEAQQTHGERERDKPSKNLDGTKGVHLGFMGDKPTNSCGSVKEESADGSLGSNEIKNGDWVRDSAVSEFKRGSRVGKKEEIAHAEAKIFNGAKESYDFVEKWHPGKSSFEGARSHKSTSEVRRKRSKNLRFEEDERVACDALQTLAEMSEMMPFLSDNPVEDGGDPISKTTHPDLTVRDEDIRVYKKKRMVEATKDEVRIGHYVKPAENKTLADKEVKPASSNGHISTISRSYESSMKSPDVSSTINRPSEQFDVVVSSSQVHPVSQIGNPTRKKNSRKRDRTLLQIDRNSAPNVCRDECMSSSQYRVQCLKEKVSRCLSWHDARRWCIYEWFYSAIDYPWFAKREFVEYLEHVGLGHVPRLTRVEWGVIRSSLGKPRRFSQRFLQEEREKLKQYRESVRGHYGNLRAGHGEGLPTDLARPLSVGQRVVAIHPKTRDVHNGSILTVDHQSCLIQFDSANLGVELVMDIDCMPLHPEENIPEVLRRPKMSFDLKFSQGRSINGPSTVASQEYVKKSSSDLYISSFNPSITSEVKPVSTTRGAVTGNGSLGTSSLTQSYNMGHKNDSRPIPGSKQILHGKGIEQHNGYLGNPVCIPQPGGQNGTIHGINSSTFSCEDTESNVAQVVKGSRDAAQRMVDIAIEAITSIKEGDDAFGRIGEALDGPNKTAADSAVNNYKATVVAASNTTVQSLAGGTRSADACAENDTKVVPSKLISSCVATLLMIQACTEGQYPPGEVAQIIDNAVTSLQPCCSQNVSIYREIQMCMGRIKTQILALVPT